VPPELDRIIQKALEKDRELRYRSAAEIRADLKRLKREMDSGRVAAASHGATVMLPAAISPAAPRVRRMKAAAWIAAAAVVVLAAGLLGYRWTRGPSDRIDSLAVLPFVNASGNPDTEYLGDGISEALINDLSQLPGVRVSAPSLAFRYKGKDEDPLKAGRELNARAVITGRVTARGNQLIVQCDVMDVSLATQI